MSSNTQSQIEQQNSNSARSEVPSSSSAPQKPMTAAQAALARAQEARCFDLGRPILNPGPENGIQCAPTATVSTCERSLAVEIIQILEDLEYLTCIFLVDDQTACEQVDYWGPSLDTVLKMAIDLVLGLELEVRLYHSFRDPQDDLQARTNHQKANAAIRSCLGMLRPRDDIKFALAWYIEGEDKPHIELVGFTFEDALSRIGDLLADDVKNHLVIRAETCEQSPVA